jgi:hypothetical protein
MHRLVMNLETGELLTVPLTEEEILELQPEPEPTEEPVDGAAKVGRSEPL